MKLIVNTIFSMFVLILSSNALAKQQSSIPCPSVDNIHLAAYLIDDAIFDSGKHTYTGHMKTAIQDGNLSWYLSSRDIIAKNRDEAIIIAQNRAKSVTNVLFDDAIDKGEYVCFYYNANLPDAFLSVDLMTEIEK